MITSFIPILEDKLTKIKTTLWWRNNLKKPLDKRIIFMVI